MYRTSLVTRGTVLQGEGVAYRGRVLVELRTELGERPVQLVEDILHEDILRVQVSLHLCITPPIM